MNKSRIISVNLTGGGILGIEATDLEPGEADEEKPVAAFPVRFEDVLAPIEKIAGEVMGLLNRIGPSKASVEFGVEVAVEAGQLTALLVKGSGKANLKITLNWDGSSTSSSERTAAVSP